MVLFLIGPPGIGKTTTAQVLADKISAYHLEIDKIRHATGSQSTTNPLVEDAVNWRVLTAAVQNLARAPGQDILIDSTGASKRLPYLRYALGDQPQFVIRLDSRFAYAKCAKKWGQAYSQEQFDHIHTLIREVPADLDLFVDGQTPLELASVIHQYMVSNTPA